MNLIGTIYAVDESHIDMVKRELSINPPPMGAMATGSMICMDMDETNQELEQMFPNHVLKATLLCPPPSAMYKEIDGDQEGFIEEYYDYLDHDDSVQDFITTILLFLHVGGNILLYTPALLSDETVWMNTLLLFFFTRYGITIGTSGTSGYNYDQSYDGVVADMLFKHGYINVFDFINSNPYVLPSIDVQNKMMQELMPFCGPDEQPMDIYMQMRNSLSQYGAPLIKPALIFERY